MNLIRSTLVDDMSDGEMRTTMYGCMLQFLKRMVVEGLKERMMFGKRHDGDRGCVGRDFPRKR